ncbi:MAG: hypothetical protein WC352_08955 [Candidatus Omnitrophota bacterium]
MTSEAMRAYGFVIDLETDSEGLVAKLEKGGYDLLVCDLWCRPAGARRLFPQVRKAFAAGALPFSVLIVGPEELRAEEFKWIYEQDLYFLIKTKDPEEWFHKITAILNRRCLP